jgi:hypothetical protein
MEIGSYKKLTSPPLPFVSDAQREKFNQLYKISDSTDFQVTVLRLVVLVQNCLHIFGLFNLLDVDGLLCNATEKGLEKYYNTFLKSTLQVYSLTCSVCIFVLICGERLFAFSNESNSDCYYPL